MELRSRTLHAHPSSVSSVKQQAEASASSSVVACQQEEQLFIHGRNVKKYQETYRAVVEPATQQAEASATSSVVACQQEEQLFIHGRNVKEYQETYRAVVEPATKSCSHYSLEQGLKLKQKLWEALDRPVFLETVLPDGRVKITESRSSRLDVEPQRK